MKQTITLLALGLLLCGDLAYADAETHSSNSSYSTNFMGNTPLTSSTYVGSPTGYFDELHVGDLRANAATITGDMTVTSDSITVSSVVVTGLLYGSGTATQYGFLCDVVDSSTNATLTAANSQKVYTNSGASSMAITFTLPAAAEGIIYTFVVVDSAAVNIDCNASDQIITTNAAGDKLQNAGTAGNTITLVCRGAAGTYNWLITAINGTWSDAN